MRDMPIIPMGEEPGGHDTAGEPTPRPWQTAKALSSTAGSTARRVVGGGALDAAECFLGDAGFDRAPWLAVIFAAGIITWFVLPGPWQWCAAMAGGGAMAVAALLVLRPGSIADDTRANLRLAFVTCGLIFAFGVAAVWTRSAMISARTPST